DGAIQVAPEDLAVVLLVVLGLVASGNTERVRPVVLRRDGQVLLGHSHRKRAPVGAGLAQHALGDRIDHGLPARQKLRPGLHARTCPATAACAAWTPHTSQPDRQPSPRSAWSTCAEAPTPWWRSSSARS